MIAESQLIENNRLSRAKNYQRVEKAIAYLKANVSAQPSLEEVAAHVHLSEYHFQKMFKEWAGVTPKQFSKHLTLESAKQHLADNKSLIDTALDVGLSGSGRLHDLFITMEAVTPGQYAQLGEGLEIYYGVHPTAFGFVFVAQTERGICQLTFLEDEQDGTGLLQLESNWAKARLIHDEPKTRFTADALFEPSTAAQGTSSIQMVLLAKGTNFQIQVWKALLNLPYGAVTSYQRIADAIGKPKAVRAVASAIGANPLAYLIPCHRVLRGTGELGGYRWGLDRKSALLAWEAKESCVIEPCADMD